MRALVTGATGFVGKRLLAQLDRPHVLTRDPAKAKESLAKFNATPFAWDPAKEQPPAAAFDGIDTIIHMAGEPVAEGRWTADKKERIRESRVAGTKQLVAALAALPSSARPKTLISFSAIGIYGDRGEETLVESTPPPVNWKDDFLAEVCVAWEEAANPAADLGMRVVHPRIGIVLGENGGALAQMTTPFYLGLGAPIGSGEQWMSWIHIDDVVGMVLFAAQNESVRGPINGVGPNPARNREFSYALGRAINRWVFMPNVPGFMMHLLFGEFAGVLLASQKVLPKAPEAAGYAFKFPELDVALKDIFAAPTEKK